MSFRATALRRSFLVAIFLVLVAGKSAFAQLATSPVAFDNQDAITTSFANATSIGTSVGGGSSTPANWLRVEFHFSTTPNLTTKFLDALQIKVWVEGRDLEAKDAPDPTQGIAIGLTGTVNYINVPAGKDCYGVVYLHPNTLNRYNAGGGFSDFDQKFNIHAQLLVGGTLMDEIDKKKETDPNWYKTLRVVPNLIMRQDQTPFIVTDPDRYPQLKPQTDSSSQ
jgi:hypothetical protein